VRASSGDIETCVCDQLQGSFGNIGTAVVFTRVVMSSGTIRVLHCLRKTDVRESFGKIKNTVYHTQDELVAIAHQLTGI
jgi:hypothetical protein